MFRLALLVLAQSSAAPPERRVDFVDESNPDGRSVLNVPDRRNGRTPPGSSTGRTGRRTGRSRNGEPRTGGNGTVTVVCIRPRRASEFDAESRRRFSAGERHHLGEKHSNPKVSIPFGTGDPGADGLASAAGRKRGLGRPRIQPKHDDPCRQGDPAFLTTATRTAVRRSRHRPPLLDRAATPLRSADRAVPARTPIPPSRPILVRPRADGSASRCANGRPDGTLPSTSPTAEGEGGRTVRELRRRNSENGRGDGGEQTGARYPGKYRVDRSPQLERYGLQVWLYTFYSSGQS